VNVDFSPRAARQIDAARRWWLRNREKNPAAFDEDLHDAQRLLSGAPYAGIRWRTRSGKFVRRVTLERIRYFLYYRVHPDRVEVIFFWHTSRRPSRL
jgi:plasmid stabilization system protein ParE